MSIVRRRIVVHDTRDIPYTYKGESTVVSAVTGDYCPAMLHFNKQVKASIVDPDFIVSVRRKLALDQREAAVVLVVESMRFHGTKPVRPSRRWRW